MNACNNSVDINRLKAVATVALDSSLIGFKQNIGAHLCVLPRNTVADKCVGNKIGD